MAPFIRDCAEHILAVVFPSLGTYRTKPVALLLRCAGNQEMPSAQLVQGCLCVSTQAVPLLAGKLEKTFLAEGMFSSIGSVVEWGN